MKGHVRRISIAVTLLLALVVAGPASADTVQCRTSNGTVVDAGAAGEACEATAGERGVANAKATDGADTIAEAFVKGASVSEAIGPAALAYAFSYDRARATSLASGVAAVAIAAAQAGAAAQSQAIGDGSFAQAEALDRGRAEATALDGALVIAVAVAPGLNVYAYASGAGSLAQGDGLAPPICVGTARVRSSAGNCSTP